jgi:hypothetical protein
MPRRRLVGDPPSGRPRNEASKFCSTAICVPAPMKKCPCYRRKISLFFAINLPVPEGWKLAIIRLAGVGRRPLLGLSSATRGLSEEINPLFFSRLNIFSFQDASSVIF